MLLKKYLIIWCGVLCIVQFVRAIDNSTTFTLINNTGVRQSQNLWERMRAGFRLEHVQSSRVVYYEKLYTKNPATFLKILHNALPYMYYILTMTERNGIPSEVALLPGVESTFNPQARSTSNAYGLWQFVRSTGTRFNLTQTSGIDQRQDIIKSTQAALLYLNYLYSIFGQWEPALAAYNWGEGNMYKTIIKSGGHLGNIDYYSLNLRQETADYVPKLIALASIIDNPSKFGITLPDTPNQPVFAILNPRQNTSIKKLLEQAQMNQQTFRVLNPQYRSFGYDLTPEDNILLPLSNQMLYYATLGIVTSSPVSNIPDSNLIVNNQATTASSDEILHIADNADNTNQSNTAPPDGTNINSQVGNTTLIAMPESHNSNNSSASDDSLNMLIKNIDNHTIETPASQVSYTVVAHDTVYSIARYFKVSLVKLRQQNHIPGNDIIVGQKLIIPTMN